MTSFTYGPWTVQPSEDDPYGDIRIGRVNRSVCKVWLDDAPVEDYNREQRANAKLIAAAPEMLNLIERMYYAIHHDCDYESKFAAEAFLRQFGVDL